MTFEFRHGSVRGEVGLWRRDCVLILIVFDLWELGMKAWV